MPQWGAWTSTTKYRIRPNYRTMRLGFSKLLRKLKDSDRLVWWYLCGFSDFLYKSICCGYSFELHRQVDAIQMSTDNICLYKEVARKYTCCNLKTTELLNCALIGVCAVIRSNTVCFCGDIRKHLFFCSFLLKKITLFFYWKKITLSGAMVHSPVSWCDWKETLRW